MVTEADFQRIDKIISDRIDQRLRQSADGFGSVLTRLQVEELHRIVADTLDKRIANMTTGSGATPAAVADEIDARARARLATI